jgi:hypothetical protein
VYAAFCLGRPSRGCDLLASRVAFGQRALSGIEEVPCAGGAANANATVVGANDLGGLAVEANDSGAAPADFPAATLAASAAPSAPPRLPAAVKLTCEDARTCAVGDACLVFEITSFGNSEPRRAIWQRLARDAPEGIPRGAVVVAYDAMPPDHGDNDDDDDRSGGSGADGADRIGDFDRGGRAGRGSGSCGVQPSAAFALAGVRRLPTSWALDQPFFVYRKTTGPGWVESCGEGAGVNLAAARAVARAHVSARYPARGAVSAAAPTTRPPAASGTVLAGSATAGEGKGEAEAPVADPFPAYLRAPRETARVASAQTAGALEALLGLNASGIGRFI